MSLLAVLIVKKSFILTGIFLSLQENVLDQTWMAFNTKFGPQWKDQQISYHLRQILACFCKSVALILS